MERAIVATVGAVCVSAIIAQVMEVDIKVVLGALLGAGLLVGIAKLLLAHS